MRATIPSYLMAVPVVALTCLAAARGATVPPGN
jgi:hypothetical protein